ncbi:hypothetical protein Lal_00008396, partial [Lupinus albus]
MQSIPKTARLSDITNEVGFWQACRSATALGKSEGNGARGDAATTPDVSNHGAAAIRKLGRRRCKSTRNVARRHTPRGGKETGVQNVDIITEESALIRLLTPKAGWDGEWRGVARSRLVFAYCYSTELRYGQGVFIPDPPSRASGTRLRGNIPDGLLSCDMGSVFRYHQAELTGYIRKVTLVAGITRGVLPNQFCCCCTLRFCCYLLVTVAFALPDLTRFPAILTASPSLTMPMLNGKPNPTFIGAIDQGTTSSRFLIFDTSGEVVTTHQLEFKQYYPHP